ncbi:MarR family winged helix-turn-helix transcriptional regulator [Streptomyces sp. NPDC094038]|uniref:MarR family winged helix-turn-helix transcriptional regulator n=1 Tax=Streptomyces sp. NPDC094038 TaxID=3366055 RepID=UPI00380DDFFD
MTGPSGSADDRSDGPPEGLMALAVSMADAVEGLTTLWSVAAQGARVRLSPHQLRALQIMEAEPGLNLTALAVRTDVGLPAASRLCDRLEAAGLLERELHPRNRRAVRLHVTRQGRQALAEVAGRRARRLAAALGAMEPPEAEALGRGLRGFLAALDGMTGGEDTTDF